MSAFQTPGLQRFKRFIRGELAGPPVSRLAMATSSALVVEGGVRELVKGRLPEEILSNVGDGGGAGGEPGS